MKTRLISLACLIVLVVSGDRLAQGQERVVAFVDVNVVPMNSERILQAQTVIVGQGKIVSIGPSETTKMPENAVQVDGSGKYLMPGLVDAHVHLRQVDNLRLFIANGVTTVRNMSGSRRHVIWRRQIQHDKLLGPTIYTTGPVINGKGRSLRRSNSAVVETAAQAERVVAEQKKAGYDFIKVYDRLTAEAYRGVVSAAKKHGIPVVGHVPWSVGLDGVLAAGQRSIEHLFGFVDKIQRDDAPERGGTAWWQRTEAFRHIEVSRMTSVARAIRDAGSWSCVTLVASDRLVPGKQAGPWLTRPEMKYLSPKLRAAWGGLRFRGRTWNAQLYDHAKQMRRKMTQALHDVGARVLLGTDAMSPFVVPGFSVHEELLNLVEAGLTPFKAIRAGTRDAAEFLGALDRFGTVSVGKRADLILVDGNPLKDVANVAKRVGVMVRGRWLPEAELNRMLAKMAARFSRERRPVQP